MLSAAFLLDLGRRLALSLAKDVVQGLGARIAGSFRAPEIDHALQEALLDALKTSLPDALPDVDDSAESGHLRQHLDGLLTEFLKSEPVVIELTLLLDPRPGVFIDTQKLADGFPYEHDDFPGLDLKRFLDRFVEEFYRAVVLRTPLQKLIEIKLLGEQVAALKEGVRVQHQVVDELAAIRRTFQDGFREMIESGNDRLVIDNVNILIQGGWLDAYSGYEALVAAVRGQGYEVEVGDDQLALEAPRFSEQPRLPPAGEATVRRLAGELRRAVLAHSPEDDDLDAIEQRYRRRLDAWLGHLEFRGMMSASRPIRLPLADVYVDLRSVAEVPEAADAFSVDERRLLLELEADGESVDERRRGLTDQLDALRRERWNRTLPERQPIADALHRADRRALVVLGDPGSGKTTLLHFLTLVYARSRAAERLGVPASEAGRLPIFVPLAAYDDMRRTRPELTLRDFLALYYDTRRGLPGLAPLFRRALDSGRALVLLDGLDEVLDVTTRRFVADQVAALMNEHTPRGVRFVLSSRVVGYREAPVSGQVATLTVLDFGLREIEVFVRQWARAFEVWLAEGESAAALEKAAALERDLLDDVRSNPSVQRLAANPLMLTMLALLRRQVGRLPHRRIELYEKYVETLLENWIEARSFGARTETLERLDRHQAENVLIPLALWMQRTHPSGTARRHEMQDFLTGIYLEEEWRTRAVAGRKELRQAQDQAERFLREMRSMAGLIIERGHDAYGFLHLTFQEHFAGRALAQLSDEDRWQVVRNNLHDPRWREPILLCAGRLGIVEGRRAQVTGFVGRIFENDDPTEPDLRRNLLLALAIACDDVNLDASLTDTIVETASGLVPSGTPVLDRKILEALGQLVADGAADLEACFRAHLDSDDERRRRDSAEVLGRCLDVQALRKTFLEWLDHEDWQVRKLAVRVLARGIDDAKIRSAVLNAFNDDIEYVRQEALRTVAPLREDAEIRNAVRNAFNNAATRVRQEALRTVAPLLEDAQIRSAVLNAFNDRDWPVRQEALRTVASLLEDAQIRSAVLNAFNDDSYDVRQEALRTVAPQLEDAEIRSAVTRGLDDPAPQVREAALRLLPRKILEAGPLQERFFQDDWPLRKGLPWILAEVLTSVEHYKLFCRLRDESGSTSSHAIAARLLARWTEVTGDRSPGVRYLSDPAWEVRQEALRTVAPQLEDAQIRSAVLNAFNDDSEWVRQEALRTVAPLLEDAEIRSTVLNAFNDRYPDVRREALRTVAPLLEDGEIRSTVLNAFNDRYPQVRQEALRTVAPLLEDAEIRSTVLNAFNDSWFDIRQEALRTVAPLLEDGEIRSAVLNAFNDDYPQVRQEALRTMAPLLEDGEIRSTVLNAFNDAASNVRREALRTVAPLLEDGEIRNAVLNTFNDDSFHVRLTCVEILLSSAILEEVPREILSEIEGWISIDAQMVYLSSRNRESTHQVQLKLAGRLAVRLPDNELRERMLALLNDVRASSRLGAAYTLLAWPGGPPDDVRDRILAAVDDRRDLDSYPARLEATSYLLNRNETSADSVELCLEALDYGTRPWEFLPQSSNAVRKQAALVLSKLEPLEDNQRAYDKLLGVLRGDADANVRDAAYEALVRLARAREMGSSDGG